MAQRESLLEVTALIGLGASEEEVPLELELLAFRRGKSGEVEDGCGRADAARRTTCLPKLLVASEREEEGAAAAAAPARRDEVRARCAIMVWKK